MKICREVRVCFDPLKCHILSFKIDCCCITASFTVSRMNSWTLSLHWSWLCWCYRHFLSATSRQCPPINAFAAILGLKLSLCATCCQWYNISLWLLWNVKRKLLVVDLHMLVPMTFSNLGLNFQAYLCNYARTIRGYSNNNSNSNNQISIAPYASYRGASIDRRREQTPEWILPHGQGCRSGY